MLKFFVFASLLEPGRVCVWIYFLCILEMVSQGCRDFMFSHCFPRFVIDLKAPAFIELNMLVLTHEEKYDVTQT